MPKQLFSIVAILFFYYGTAQRAVTGIVTDMNDMPLSGVNVNLQGTDLNTVTDIDGKYSIAVADESAILVFRAYGFKALEIVVGNRQNVDVKFEADDVQEIIAETIALPGYATVRVFFASDRNLTGNNEPAKMFGNIMSAVRYGECQVSIPLDHRMGELEEATFLEFGSHNDPEKHVVLLDVNLNTKDDFFVKIRNLMGNPAKKNALVFVHGFNVSFEDASRRTAQIAYDLSFPGVPVFYSWPSQNKMTLGGYNTDARNIKRSQKNLENFIADFLKKSNAENVYFIAHSMGNRGLTRALTKAIKDNPAEANRVKEIILAAPDINADTFKRDIAPALIACKKPITLYVSSKDLALVASATFSRSVRVGQAGDRMVIIPGIETIDVSKLDTGLLGHSYYGDSTSVICDIREIIHYNKRPDQRAKLLKKMRQDLFFWEFSLN
jgi:esterase/lipase superfamily enzyme